MRPIFKCAEFCEKSTIAVVHRNQLGSGYCCIAEVRLERSLISVDDQASAGFTVTRNDSGRTAVTLLVYLEIAGTAARGADWNASNLTLSSGTAY